MKIFMRINWVDYYLDAAPAEVATLNKLIGSARVIEGTADEERVLTLGTSRPSLHMRILADDCVATAAPTEDPKE